MNRIVICLKIADIERNADGSSLLGYVTTEPLFALDGPKSIDVVKRFESWNIFRKIKPWQFAPRKDVNIRLDCFRMIKRPDANQKSIARRRVIFAPQVCAASVAEKHLVLFSAARGELERLRHGGARFDKFSLDPDVSYKCAASKTLTVAAMTERSADQRLTCSAMLRTRSHPLNS